MNHRKVLYGLILYIISIVLLFIFILLHQCTYDDWILNGFVIPVAAFVMFSVAALVLTNNNKLLVVIAGIFVVVMNIIPGLKYPYFYNTFDSPAHFRFVDQIASLGYVPQGEFYSVNYGNNPAMHIFLAELSVISGISVNDLFKFFIPLLFGLVPFIVYFVGHRILDKRTLKYTIVASSFPIIQGYVVWGTTLAFIPYLLLVAVFLRLAFSKIFGKTFFSIFCVLSFALITSHAVTSFFVSLLFLGAFIVYALLVGPRHTSMQLSIKKFGVVVLIYIALLMTWWSTVDTVNLEYLFSLSSSLFGGDVPAIPTRFFQLSFVPQLQYFVVVNSANTIIFGLSLLALVIIFNKIRKKQLSDISRDFYLLILSLVSVVVVFVVAQVAASFGVFSYQRFLIYGVPWCFFLAGLFLSRIEQLTQHLKPMLRSAVSIFLIASMVFVCIIQFFPPQPLVPRASALSQNLPGDPYVVDLSVVNTIYQKQMISFATDYSEEGIVIADSVTRAQCYGFSSPLFFSRIEYDSPLVSGLNQNLQWTLFLIHSSKAGPFEEKPENRTATIIQNLLSNSGDFVYTNGESYILYNPVQNFVP